MTMAEGLDGATDDEPSAELNFANGTSLIARRNNTTLFTFWGRMSMYDHVFVANDSEENDGSAEEDGPDVEGQYVFQDSEHFAVLRDLIMRHSFPQVLNVLHPLQVDIDAFEQQHLDDMAARIDAMLSSMGGA